MSSGWTIALILAAVFGFWIVGAYNRLVRLRSAINTAFGPLDVQIRQRHELLQLWTQALRDVLDDSVPAVDAVQAAAEQLLLAEDKARQRPSAQPAIASLRLAEEALASLRSQLVAELPAHLNQPILSERGIDLAGLGDQILAVDSTLAFARQQFNTAVDEYNQALTQFPTNLLTGLFGFQAAASL